jgi:arylformamidase
MCKAAIPRKIWGGSPARAVLPGRWRVEIIDITAPVGPGSVMWPGQDPPSREFLSHTDRGDWSTVSVWHMSAHTGTHADARMHFIPGGWTMESLKLSRCVGPCRVRLLLKTRSSEDGLLEREGFVEDYVAIEREAAEYLVEIGVETVGVDYLSVEPFEDKEFNTHHALLGADVIVVEGLLLSGVEPGEYFLVCLPLKLEDSDGAPARAILIRGLL